MSIQVFHSCRVHQVDFGDLISATEAAGKISLCLLCSHSSWDSALDLTPLLRVGHPRASVLRSHRTGLKEQLIQGLWLTQAEGMEGYGMRGEPVAAEAGVTLQQPEACHVFSQGSCPWIMVSWQWRLHRLPGGEVWRVTCARTQASWWLQQQP